MRILAPFLVYLWIVRSVIRQIHMLTAIGLTPGGSSTVHIYTQTIHRTTQLIWKECGPCTVFASYTLVFALQLREKHEKNSVRVTEECQLGTMKTEYTEQNIHNNKNTNLQN